MKIENLTHYETPGIRAMILAGLKHVGVPHEQLRVRIVYNRRRGSTWHGGCAQLGRVEKVPVLEEADCVSCAGTGFFDRDTGEPTSIVRNGTLPCSDCAGAAKRKFRTDDVKYRTIYGRRMTLSFPREPHLIDVGEFCRTIVHEALHLKGVQHGEMTTEQRFCRGPFPAWAVNLKTSTGELAQIRVRPAKPEPTKEDRAEERREKRAAHLKKMVALWDMRLKRAKTISAKWRRKLANAERQENLKRAAKPAASGSGT